MTYTSAQCLRCRKMDIEARFLRYVNKTNDCWLWAGHVDAKGYGRFTISSGTERAHRVAFTLWVGPIPSGSDVHHECERHNCVRPDHLRALAPADHARHHLAKRYQG